MGVFLKLKLELIVFYRIGSLARHRHVSVEIVRRAVSSLFIEDSEHCALLRRSATREKSFDDFDLWNGKVCPSLVGQRRRPRFVSVARLDATPVGRDEGGEEVQEDGHAGEDLHRQQGQVSGRDMT